MLFYYQKLAASKKKAGKWLIRKNMKNQHKIEPKYLYLLAKTFFVSFIFTNSYRTYIHLNINIYLSENRQRPDMTATLTSRWKGEKMESAAATCGREGDVQLLGAITQPDSEYPLE